MSDGPHIVAAKQEVERSRARLFGTAHALQDRLSPKTLARDAWEGAKDKGANLAEDAVDAVRARPIAATGVAAVIAMFLAREPLMDLGARLVARIKAKRQSRKRPKPRSRQDRTEKT
jgi:ElaB/YqjD/DUF883 family membrane-anchored ribosome-binding protein